MSKYKCKKEITHSTILSCFLLKNMYIFCFLNWQPNFSYFILTTHPALNIENPLRYFSSPIGPMISRLDLDDCFYVFIVYMFIADHMLELVELFNDSFLYR